MKKEEWRDIPNYEGYYQVSNLGRVRSLDRTITFSNGSNRFYKGFVIGGSINKGYRQTTLCVNGTKRAFKFSQLVAITFLGHNLNGVTLVVDHINGDKSDDRVENLRIVTQRENSSTCFRSDREFFSSGYAGVYWNKNASMWVAKIRYNGMRSHLGNYDSELEASTAYQSALSKIKDGSFNTDDYKPKWTSKHKGVCFHKGNNKWQAYITANGKQKNLGLFKTEIEAHEAYQSKLKELNNKKTTI